MAITLKEVTSELFDKIMTLRVKDEQKDPIHNPRHFLALSAVEQDLRLLAIHYNEELVGFCVYGTDDEDGTVWIQSLMIDAKYQGKGYSLTALKSLINLIRQERNPTNIFTSIGQNNTAARSLFQNVGFSPSGENGESLDVWSLPISNFK